MTKKKELRQLYGGRKPKSYRLAHNHIMHTNATSHGDRGFRRFWISPQWITDGGWEKCPCGWHNGDEHYAVKEHVDHWKKQIKKLGSLDAAYRDVNRRLAAYFKKLWRDMEIRAEASAMSEVTSLQQARELKAAGLPPNLKVVTKHWSRKTSELMFSVDRAQGKFLDKVWRYSGSDDRRKYDSMIRAYNKLFDAVTALVEWSDELKKTHENEAAALHGVIDQQMAPMLDHFDAVFEQLENGEAVSFQLGINNPPAVARP